MAEVVEKNLEATLQELELMQEFKLLTKEEIKKLVEVRRNFEYKLVRPKKNKEDFVDYVHYEANLIKFLLLRRKLLNVKEGRNQIDRVISLRVVRRLRFMTRSWPQHSDLWELRRDFCRLHDYVEEVTNCYLEQLGFHGNDESLWVSFAQWQVEHVNDVPKAREILLMKATEYHPKSVYISRKGFRLELLLAERSLSSDEETNKKVSDETVEKVPDLKIAEAVYEDAIEKFESDSVHMEFYNVADQFPFAKDLRERIFSDMKEQYPEATSTWILTMQRFIRENNFTLTENLEELLEKLDEIDEETGTEFRHVYIKELLHYLYCLWNEDTSAKAIKLKLNELLDEDDEDTPLNLFEWLLKFELSKLENATGDESLEILKKCSDIFDGNQIIEQKLLEAKLSQKETDEDKVKAFRRYVKKLDKEGAKKAWLHIHTILDDESSKLQICEEGATKEYEVAYIMRLKLLETEDIQKRRMLYKKHHLDNPSIAEFHIKMIQKELSLERPSMEIIRLAFETSTRQFGKHQRGLWLSYAEFEKKYSGTIQHQRILDKGQHMLDPNKVGHYETLKTALIINRDTTSRRNHDKKPEEEIQSEWKKSQFFQKSTMEVFEESEEREIFFNNLSSYKDVKPQFAKKDLSLDEEWEVVMKLLGRSIFLSEPENQIEGPSVDEDAKKFINEQLSYKDQKKPKISCPLVTASVASSSKNVDKISKLLEESDILKPDFNTQKEITPYWRSRRSMKKERKAKYEETAGKGWFNMKPTKITPEIEKSLFFLKNRSALDPKRHYKKSDMKHTPKYFQVGKVQDNAFDFYSDRVPKKSRGKNFAEEIVKNEEVLRDTKRRHQKIMAETKRWKRQRKE